MLLPCQNYSTANFRNLWKERKMKQNKNFCCEHCAKVAFITYEFSTKKTLAKHILK